MARRGSTTAAKRLARLQERLAVVRRARAGEGGPVVVYADDEQAVREYVNGASAREPSWWSLCGAWRCVPRASRRRGRDSGARSERPPR